MKRRIKQRQIQKFKNIMHILEMSLMILLNADISIQFQSMLIYQFSPFKLMSLE